LKWRPREKQRTKKKKYEEKKGEEENKNYSPCKLPPWGQLHPIHEIPKYDFLDGALVGAGSLKPIISTYKKSLVKSD
jgi:hypothetical protein